MIINKKYRFNGDAPSQWRNSTIIVTKITKTTIWFRLIDDPVESYLYHREWKDWVEELSTWSGSKVLFNFMVN